MNDFHNSCLLGVFLVMVDLFIVDRNSYVENRNEIDRLYSVVSMIDNYWLKK